MGSNFVSIVVPAYNAEQYLKQTLESIFSQTYRNFEIILVDDGSTDDTPRIAQQLENSIQYIRQPNQGLAAARNTAIKNARADIIALLDADDLWESQFLERMINLLNMHPEAAGVYCGFKYINSKGDIVGNPSLRTVPPELFHETMVNEGNWLAPCTVIFRKQLAEELGLFDETLRAVEDWDMWIRLSEHQPFIGLPEALARYRRHENNMSKDPERMINATDQLIQKRYGPPEDDVSAWSSSKKRAYCNHYRGAAISFFSASMMRKSVDFLQRLADIEPDFACSLYVWRGMARAYIPVEYQFDSITPHNWVLMETKIVELLEELAKQRNRSTDFYSLYPKMRGFAFLALADEAGRSGEAGRAFYWLQMTVRSYFPLLLERPFWGTLLRSVTATIKDSSPSSKSEVIS